MGSECLHLLRFERVRVSRLLANGIPDPGAGNLYVSDAQISLAVGFNNRAGDDFESPNGAGRICYAFLEPDKYKSLTLALTMCDHDPEFIELLVGGDLIQDGGGNSFGYALPAVGESGNEDGVSLEGWTLNMDGSGIDADYPYVQWVFPRTLWTPADKTLENGPINQAFTGVGRENSNYFDGPADDHPDNTVSGRLYSYFGTDTIPDAECGAQTLVAS